MRAGVLLEGQSSIPGGGVARRTAAFSLIELLVVLAIVATLILFGMPAMLNALNRAKLTGFAQTVASSMQAARLEAVKRGGTARVELQASTSTSPARIVAYVDDGDHVFKSGTDVLVATVSPPSGVSFGGPGPDPVSAAATAISYLVTPTGVAAVFNPDGSVVAVGGFRFRDSRGNIMEAFVSPQSGARVAVRKYAGNPTSADDLNKYFESDQLAQYDSYYGASANQLTGWQWR
jgi:prepilin-type N-terminal cleavage/methylation domain-containing protein